MENRSYITIVVFDVIIFFSKILFIYVTERQPAREGTQQGRGRGRSRLPAEDPNVGLDPGMLGSHPEPKAEA